MRRRVPNVEVFLALYIGQRYHLQEWRGAGNAPTTAKSTLTWNIPPLVMLLNERSFCWRVDGQYFAVSHTIPYKLSVEPLWHVAYYTISSTVRWRMSISLKAWMRETPPTRLSKVMTFNFIENSNEWTQWQDDLVVEMFNQWQLSNQ